MHAALERVFHETRADPAPLPIDVGRELTEQQARNRIGRLARADRARQHVRHDGRRRETIVADDTTRLMNDDDGCKAFLLIGKCASLEPVIERRLPAGESGNAVSRRERFGYRDSHGAQRLAV